MDPNSMDRDYIDDDSDDESMVTDCIQDTLSLRVRLALIKANCEREQSYFAYKITESAEEGSDIEFTDESHEEGIL